MLLLGHAAVSARRGPRGTCQETRAAPWAPAECGVTARSASDGVDVNGIRVHHRRLQYRRHQGGPYVNSAGGVRFPDRSLNLIGNCVRPEPWLRPPHIRARQSRATKFISALRTCLRTVPGVRAPRAGMRLLSNAFRRGRHYFVARSADQNNAACPRTRWKATSFLPEQVSLPAHLQIRKLFSKKCLHSSRIIGYYLPR